MHELPIRRLASAALGIVIIFTILGLSAHHGGLVRGVWLAFGWQAASLTCLAMAAHLLRQPASKGRAWRLAGIACLKFPVLYTVGYWLLRATQPSAVGLLVGLTIPWVVLTVWATLRVWKNPVSPATVQSR